MKVKTLGGASHFVNFINDASKKVRAYALKIKNQVLDVFKYFHAMVESEIRKSLKYISTQIMVAKMLDHLKSIAIVMVLDMSKLFPRPHNTMV